MQTREGTCPGSPHSQAGALFPPAPPPTFRLPSRDTVLTCWFIHSYLSLPEPLLRGLINVEPRSRERTLSEGGTWLLVGTISLFPRPLLTWVLAPLPSLSQQPQPPRRCLEPGLLGAGEKFCEPPCSGSLAVTRERPWEMPTHPPTEGHCSLKDTQYQGQPGLEPRPHTDSALDGTWLALPRRSLTPGVLLPAHRGSDKVRAEVGIVVPLGACFLEPVPCQDLQLPRVCQ